MRFFSQVPRKGGYTIPGVQLQAIKINHRGTYAPALISVHGFSRTCVGPILTPFLHAFLFEKLTFIEEGAKELL